jgi:hypothetical protein
MDRSLVLAVRRRAKEVCEYCRMPHAFYPTVPFPIDHIIARKHGGQTTLQNLALSCLHCNTHKGPNIAGLDPQTGRLTKLFHPRRHKWERHFRWRGSFLVGRSSIGRVTVRVLELNHPALVAVRQALVDEGRILR